MADFKDLTDALTDEVLSDMADSFFGARVDVDDALELFHEVSEKLHVKLYQVFRACVLLEKLCLGPDGFDDFWVSAGMSRSRFYYPAGVECAQIFDKPPFAFTGRGEYIKWFGIAYDMLAASIEEYMHGSIKDDGNGRKIRTVNREDFFRMADEINVKIEKVNKNVTASDVLKFTKSLDPAAVQKESIAGCVGPQCKVIDDEMAFTLVTLKDIDFPQFPDLPDRNEVSSYISGYCSQVWARDKVRVRALIEDLKKNVNKELS
ncbi:hypothetical protein [Desulfovibrio sp. JC022]|uniref:hypothetical protein n=1 Tax=Desulfovibrio sp. JC022 TaxID=2593642 RepID=UPI0013D2307C|nr:hypothetical protein [Desulfovibrio sp. JC022]NDV24470.1 hypothetical protein [Desulfovibrio sp. JC022]